MSCVKAVRETLSKLDGVEKVEVDFKAKSATVSLKPGAKLTKDDVQKAFQGTKYGVTSFEKPKQDKKKKKDVYVLGIAGMT